MDQSYLKCLRNQVHKSSARLYLATAMSCESNCSESGEHMNSNTGCHTNTPFYFDTGASMQPSIRCYLQNASAPSNPKTKQLHVHTLQTSGFIIFQTIFVLCVNFLMQLSSGGSASTAGLASSPSSERFLLSRRRRLGDPFLNSPEKV